MRSMAFVAHTRMKLLKWRRSPALFNDLFENPMTQFQNRIQYYILSAAFCYLPSLMPPKESCPIPKLTLTQEELTQINLLIPRLCLSSHLTAAIDLVAAALLANTPPKSISFSILVHFLTLQPDLALPMSLLTRLKHTQPPAHPHIASLAGMLVSSYLHKGRPKDAFKVYMWMVRPGSVCSAERRVYGVLVYGLCRSGLVLEGLRVLRDMVKVDLVPGDGLKRAVVRSLLREARVREAREVEMALDCGGNMLILLDGIITCWTE